MSNRVTAALRSPEVATDALQVLKSTIAGTVAWWLAVAVFNSEFPFLAPWTALLTVHATVYRSLNRGLQTTVSTAIGVGLSFIIGTYLGVGVWTLALALLVGMAASRLKWIKDEGVAIATTAIFVLSSGYADNEVLLVDRMIDVALGVGVGLVVNLMLIPPLRDAQASRYVDSINHRMGDVLIGIADDLAESWDSDRADARVGEAVAVNREVDSAWQSVLVARESRWANPRVRMRLARRSGQDDSRAEAQIPYEQILERVGEGSSHLRHLARTLREATMEGTRWDAAFLDTWVDIMRDAGHAIKDPDTDVEPIHDRLTSLAHRLSDAEHLPQDHWPVYGSLITSMRHIATIVDDVASARGAREASRENPA